MTLTPILPVVLALTMMCGVLSSPYRKAAGAPLLSAQKLKKTCQYVMNHLAPLSQEILHAQIKTGSLQGPWQKLDRALLSDCRQRKKAQRILKWAATLRSQHRHKVGLLLPSHRYDQAMMKNFLHGIKSACKEHILCHQKEHMAVYKLKSHHPEELLKGMHKLLITEKVSVIIGGFHPSSQDYLNRLAQAFALPVLLMAPRDNLRDLSDHTFVASPSETQLLKALIQQWKKQGVRSLALLQPEGHTHTQKQLQDLTEGSSLSLVKTIFYQKNYDSMLRASQELLQLLPHQRKEEWVQLLKDSQGDEDQTSSTISSEEVYLNPKFDYDMLVIADNAKIVRHYLKIFRYLRLSHPIPLAGTHLWRAQELIQPWDSLLEGAYFADFIGRYDRLPSYVQISDPSFTPHFIDPALMAPIDFQLLGYRSMQMALSVALLPNRNRNVLSQHLRHPYHHSEIFLQNKHELSWPTTLFGISQGHLRQLNTTSKISSL